MEIQSGHECCVYLQVRPLRTYSISLFALLNPPQAPISAMPGNSGGRVLHSSALQ